MTQSEDPAEMEAKLREKRRRTKESALLKYNPSVDQEPEEALPNPAAHTNLPYAYIIVKSTQSPVQLLQKIFLHFAAGSLHQHPHLVIRCEISPVTTPYNPQDTIVQINNKTFNMQSANPQERFNSTNKAHEFVHEIASKVPLELPDKSIRITQQPWFINAQRTQVDQYLTHRPMYSFCVRPSSVPGSFALSYNTPEGILHTLIESWDNRWYFSGDQQEQSGFIKGLFFTSVEYFVSYWQEKGLGRTWTPVNTQCM